MYTFMSLLLLGLMGIIGNNQEQNCGIYNGDDDEDDSAGDDLSTRSSHP